MQAVYLLYRGDDLFRWLFILKEFATLRRLDFISIVDLFPCRAAAQKSIPVSNLIITMWIPIGFNKITFTIQTV